ncbi:hypothetical protein [Paracoccus subflavus]|uniref:hypothetical protein n=1 Tax=Paracoccus subflavus TaxID=2528244 RepID=UPI0013EF00C8|nr:hypothetical protein [Paracoccus subflavus]
MEYEEERYFGLHFLPRHGEKMQHLPRALTLVKALEGLQRTIHLVAIMKEGR